MISAAPSPESQRVAKKLVVLELRKLRGAETSPRRAPAAAGHFRVAVFFRGVHVEEELAERALKAGIGPLFTTKRAPESLAAVSKSIEAEGLADLEMLLGREGIGTLLAHHLSSTLSCSSLPSGTVSSGTWGWRRGGR